MTRSGGPRGGASRRGAGGGGRRRAAVEAPEQVATVTVERVAAGGDGVAHHEGRVVFVPRTAPGDVVQVALRVQGRFARARVLQRLVASAERVDAPCPHYEREQCGGCQLQHLSASAQQEARRHIVQDALQRIGKRAVPLPSLTTGAAWRYRTRLTLHLRRVGTRWIGGLHRSDDPARIFPLDDCLIAHPALVSAWRTVQVAARTHPFPDAPGLRLALRLGARASGGDAQQPIDDAAPVTAIVFGGSSWSAVEACADAVAAARPGTTLAWVDATGLLRSGGADAALTASEEAEVEGPGDVRSADSGAARNAPSADEALAFDQVNAGVAAALRDLVATQVRAMSPMRVLDAYAGQGVLAERLALDGIAVTTIESDAAAVRAMEARLEGTVAARRVTALCDWVERALAALPAASLPDVVVLNPPRRGVDAAVTQWLEAAPASVRGLVYVSCDPATLARDVARLPSWRVVHLECFDMFPQTAHVESVCILQREAA
ncbi:MAG: hypothetical protein LCH84_11800 [Gemmatimonadetes bacterium]|nr:hypothetical protein [Gemmatimonadota bacterium]